MGTGELVSSRPRHWLALLVAAALAPTDAAAGLPLITNPAVPSRVRPVEDRRERLERRIVTPVAGLKDHAPRPQPWPPEPESPSSGDAPAAPAWCIGVVVSNRLTGRAW
jgi:hypothetical protein